MTLTAADAIPVGDSPTRRLALRPWRRALAWLAFLGPFFYVSYGLANHLAAARTHVPSLVFDWERQVPFWPWTIFPYWSINAFYGLSLFLCPSRHVLDRHALRLLTAQVIAIGCFIAFPLAFTFGQPPADGAAGWLFTALRGFDKPFNQAPSLHIALAVILWDFYRRLLRATAARVLLHAWTFLICASVLTTWQHHFIDIPTGALLGLFCVSAWPLERQASPLAAFRLTRDPVRMRLAAAYVAAAALCLALAIRLGGAALWLGWPAAALAWVALCYLALGPRGFAGQRAGGTTWAMRCLVAPYRIGAWINSRGWTRGQLGAVHVADGVWLGRLPSRRIDPACASAVNVAAELDSPAAVPTLHVPALDLVVPDARWLRRAAAAIERQRRRHGTVLVYCALGYSRSAAAVATWLLVSDRASSVEHAVATVRARRERIVFRQAHLAAIAAAAGRSAK